MSLSTSIKAIQDIMRTDVGVDGDAQRLGQLVWLLFLKIWDDRERELELIEPGYRSPLVDVTWRESGETHSSADMRWRSWAADPEGVTGDHLLAFVDQTLFPALKGLEVGPALDAEDPSAKPSIQLRRRRLLIRSVFDGVYQYMKSGTLLRQVINRLEDGIDFNAARTRHLFGDIYEQILRDLQGAGNAGEYYTPRPVTQFAVEMTDPRLGEIVLDPACGTGGFLTGAIAHMRASVSSAADEAILQPSIRGIEKKPLPHLLCVTNMIVHGIDVPSGIMRDNALARPVREITNRDRVDVILTNPPFQGMEEIGIENNFPLAIRSRETADLFLALVLEMLRPGGRAAIVLPDSSLFAEGVKETLRRRLLEECDLHTIVRLPRGVFSPYTDTRTNLLFFIKAAATKSIWYYEVACPVGEKYTKTKPITDRDFDDARDWWKDRSTSPYAWEVDTAELRQRGFNLDVKNPHRENIATAYQRHRAAMGELDGGLESVQQSLDDMLAEPSWPLGEHVSELLHAVVGAGPTASLSSGVMEGLRRALTELALHGEMSVPLDGDEAIEETLSRYTASSRGTPPTSPSAPPFPIPMHWEWRQLADICDFAIGRTPPTREDKYWTNDSDPGDGHAWAAIGDMPRRGVIESTKRRITDAAVQEIFKSEPTKAGALLIAFKLSVGKTALLGIDAYHNEAIASLKISDEALKAYLTWAIPALVTHAAINPAIRGSTLNRRSIANIWVPVPPREEQTRIVEALSWVSDWLDAVAETTEAIRDEADAMIKLLGHGRALTATAEEVAPA